MSHYITCHNCGEPECMDSDTGVHRRDDGTVCPDPRDVDAEGLRAEVERLTAERDEANAACLARGNLLDEHRKGCAWMARAEAAEAEVARLRAAAIPEDAEERAAEVMWARAVTRLGDASLPWTAMSDDGHVKRFWREEARAVLKALRRDA